MQWSRLGRSTKRHPCHSYQVMARGGTSTPLRPPALLVPYFHVVPTAVVHSLQPSLAKEMCVQLKRQPRQTTIDEEANSASTFVRTTVSSRRAIPVAAGQTVVVTPKLPNLYKSLIWFSFVLNAVLLVLLLVGGTYGWRMWRGYRSLTAGVTSAVNTEGTVGQTLRGWREEWNGGAQAQSDLIRSNVQATGQKLGAVTSALDDLENATIRATVPIDQQVPLAFNVPIDQDTTVVLNRPVPLSTNAQFTLPGEAGVLRGQVTLTLPPGLELPVRLSATVPVSSSVAVNWDVPVAIPVRDTELGEPFGRLRTLLQPLVSFFTPASSQPAR